MYDKITEASLLYDFYGRLLTDRQREVLQLYHEENYSLSEIAETFSISRQGVHDALKSAEKALSEYEEKLELVDKFVKMEAFIRETSMQINALVSQYADCEDLVQKLAIIQDKIKTMGQ